MGRERPTTCGQRKTSDVRRRRSHGRWGRGTGIASTRQRLLMSPIASARIPTLLRRYAVLAALAIAAAGRHRRCPSGRRRSGAACRRHRRVRLARPGHAGSVRKPRVLQGDVQLDLRGRQGHRSWLHHHPPRRTADRRHRAAPAQRPRCADGAVARLRDRVRRRSVGRRVPRCRRPRHPRPGERPKGSARRGGVRSAGRAARTGEPRPARSRTGASPV